MYTQEVGGRRLLGRRARGGRDSSPLIPVPVRVGKRTRTVPILNKYTFQSGQTHILLLTNSFCQLQTSRAKCIGQVRLQSAHTGGFSVIRAAQGLLVKILEQIVNLKERKYILRTKVGSLVGEQEALKCEGR